MDMRNLTASIIAIIIILGAGYFVTRDTSTLNGGGGLNVSEKNTETKKEVEGGVIKDGVQYVTITAKGGYFPRQSSAQAGTPTKLIVKTNSTYDCSAALVIKALAYREMLPNTGETIIDAGTPKAGDVLRGVCGMGMYSFAINFK